MALARSTGALIGTDESTLATISNNATTNGSEVDALGDNASVGDMWVYAVVTSTATTGTFDVTINTRRVTTQGYKKLLPDFSIVPINGTQKIPFGRFPVDRFVQCDAKNNGTGATGTVSILYSLEKLS